MNEELKIVITAAIDGLQKALKTASEEVEKFEKDTKSTGKAVADALNSVGKTAGTALKAVGVAAAGVATALLAVAESTKEYRAEQTKLQTSFEAAGASAEQATATYTGLYRVLGDSGKATEASAHLAQLTVNQQDLAEWATICQGVYATFGDSLPIEGLTEAANETAKTGELTGVLVDALNWAKISNEEFAGTLSGNKSAQDAFNAALSEGLNREDAFKAALQACTTEAEREALMRETLNSLYNDAAIAYEENAASLLQANEAQSSLDASMASLGETMEPIMTALKEFAANVLTQLAPYLQEFADKYLPAIAEALGEVAPKIGETIGWIADNWELVSTIGTILLAIVAALAALSAGLTAYNAIMAITTAVSMPVIGIVAAIVAGIALLVAGIVLAVKHWDDITAAVKKFADNVAQFFTGLWDNITGWISGVGESISGWWSDTKAGFSEWFGNVKEGWNNFWSSVGDKISDGVQAAKDKFQTMKESVSEKVSEIKEKVSTKFAEIKETISEKAALATDIVKSKLNNMKAAYESNGGGIKGVVAATMEGIKGYYSAGYEFIDKLTGGKLSGLVSTFKTKLDGIKDAVANGLNKVKTKFSDILESVKTIVSNAVQKLKNLFNFEWSLPKIKLPHFTVSGELDLFALPPKIPSIDIEWYAKGGVFDKPTLFGHGNQLGGLGEAGAEAIVPLENNLEWLDKLANMLSDRLGNNNTPIVLQVDGKTFARTSINSINQLTAQTGKLDLVLA